MITEQIDKTECKIILFTLTPDQPKTTGSPTYSDPSPPSGPPDLLSASHPSPNRGPSSSRPTALLSATGEKARTGKGAGKTARHAPGHCQCGEGCRAPPHSCSPSADLSTCTGPCKAEGSERGRRADALPYVFFSEATAAWISFEFPDWPGRAVPEFRSEHHIFSSSLRSASPQGLSDAQHPTDQPTHETRERTPSSLM